MDTILINLITFFLSTQPVNVIYHEAYFLRDSVEGTYLMSEVKSEPIYIDDYNGRFIPPSTIHITLWAFDPPQHYEYKTTCKLMKLLGWERFRILFILLHEISHYKYFREGCYPDEDEIDLEAEELIKERFEEIKGICEKP